MRPPKYIAYLLFVACLIIINMTASFAQDNRVIRMAKIKIDSSHLEAYNAAVKEQIEAAVSKEPGVLMLYAVHDKLKPTSVTVFEIYADMTAYRSHLETPHFKKYKTGTAHMVKSLELIDLSPIALRSKSD